ncbi:TRAP transporter substrate-binding protein [Neobacillus vireti]|uniref:TRAP transporter substrate-binding protein n=1 Tax=Neobacillus vireti TaxID=220686 RepID=UPI002FFF8801
MFIKRFSILIGFLVSIIIIAAGCTSSSNADPVDKQEKENSTKEKITLKLATPVPTTNSFSKNLVEPFMERVTELSDGQVQFKYFPGEQLGKGHDLLDLTKDGVADIAYYATPYYPSKMPIGSSLTGMPGLFVTAYQGTMAYHAVIQQSPILEKDFLNNGVRPITTFLTPTLEFYTKGKEIKVPEDLKGLKVRTPGGVASEILEFVGATPINVAAPELYESFERGVVNTMYTYNTAIDNFGLSEIVKYGTHGASFGSNGVGLVINENVWKGLPEDVKEIISQVGQEVTEENAKKADHENKTVIDKWNTKGITNYVFSKAEKEKWQRVADEFNKYWLKEQNSPDFNKAFEMFKEEVEKHK